MGFAISCSLAMENPQQIIDCNGERFTLTPDQQQILNNECATTRDYISDPQVRKKSTIHFEGGPSFLDQNNLNRLMNYMRSPANTTPNNSPKNTSKRQKKLLALIAAAEYLQAPKKLLRELWVRGYGRFNAPHLKHYEPEFNALGDKLFSLGEYINQHYEIKTYTKKNPEQAQYTPILYGEDTFRIHSLQGLSVLCDIVECASLQRLILSGENLADFNLKEFTRLMPHLKYLDLGSNKIRILKRQHVDGMPQNFCLYLGNNPIESIEKDCLSGAIIARASGSSIHLNDTKLTPEQLEQLVYHWGLHTDAAQFVVFGMHWIALCVSFPACILVAIARDKPEQCRPIDFIDASCIITNSLLSTFYMMYIFHKMSAENESYKPESIKFKCTNKEYTCYNDSFARHFWAYLKFSLAVKGK